MELTFDELMQELKELEKEREQRQQDLADSKDAHEQEVRANRELQARLTKLEGEVRSREREVDDLLARRNHQMAVQQKESESSQALNDRLDRNVEAILEYQSINQEVRVGKCSSYRRFDSTAARTRRRENC